MGQIGLGAVCPAHPAEGLVAEAVQILVVCTAEDPHSHLVQHTGMGAVCVPHYKRHAVAVLTVFQRVNRVGQHHQGKTSFAYASHSALVWLQPEREQAMCICMSRGSQRAS